MAAKVFLVVGALLALLSIPLAGPALGQGLTVLDQAQDGGQSTPRAPAPPPPICGTRPITIASMPWASAQILAEIHSRLLARNFGCQTLLTPGDLATTGSSMATAEQPAVAPELWLGRIADAWNLGIKAQKVRVAANAYTSSAFEGWFIPDYLAAAAPGLTGATLRTQTALFSLEGRKPRFISCPIDWSCALINRNLLKALGLDQMFELVEPANRFEMDTLIAQAVSGREPFVFYYWQPNVVLAQLAFASLDLGPYDATAMACLAQKICVQPVPSSFAPESVVIALSEWVFTGAPAIAGYFQRASLPLADMNRLLTQLNEPGATAQSVADRFVGERSDLWGPWVGAAATPPPASP